MVQVCETVSGIPASDLPSVGPPKVSEQALLRYPGSKWKLMPRVVPLLPFHKHFVSVFGGSGAEILQKPRSRLESFNDLDSHIYNLFRVVKDGNADELKRRLRATPERSRQFYDDARLVLSQPITDSVESAWAYIVVSHMGICTVAPPLQTASQFGYGITIPRASKWQKLPTIIDDVKRRFCRVQLFKTTWDDLIARLDGPDTCFLLDPPYHPSTLKCNKPLYVHEMSEAEHEKMLETILAIKGKALIFNYANGVYDKALKAWKRVEFETFTGMGMRGNNAPRTDVLWIKP